MWAILHRSNWCLLVGFRTMEKRADVDFFTRQQHVLWETLACRFCAVLYKLHIIFLFVATKVNHLARRTDKIVVSKAE